MNRARVWIALALILLPPLGRTLWHYRGLYRPPDPIEVPRYSEITPPQLPAGRPLPMLPEQDASAEAPPGARPKVVLFDQAHSNRFTLAELRSLTSGLNSRGARVEVFDSSFAFDELGLAGRLKYASAFVVVAPSTLFSPDEVEAVEAFVERGGRLLVVLDPTRTGSNLDFFGFLVLAPSHDVASANHLLAPFDLVFSDDYLYNLTENEGNFRNVLLRSFGEHPITAGLETIALYAARSVQSQAGTPLLSASPSSLSSLTDTGGALSAGTLGPGGQTLALGDLTFLTSPYDQVADNPRLIHNLADFLLAGERRLDLRDLPFVFSGPVSLVRSEDFLLQAETLFALRSFAEALAPSGADLVFPDEAPVDGDLLVLGRFQPDPALEPLLMPLGLVLPGSSDDGRLEVPGFGSFEPTGIGLVVLHRSDSGTRLVLLAEGPEELVRLLESVALGSFFDCLVGHITAVCRVGEGAGFNLEEPFEFEFGLEEPAFP